MMGTILGANSYLARKFNIHFKKYTPFCVHMLPAFIIIDMNSGKLFN